MSVPPILNALCSMRVKDSTKHFHPCLWYYCLLLSQGDAWGLSREEEEMGAGLVERMVEGLEIKDWGLLA